MRNITLTVEQVLSFGIRLSDGAPFVLTIERQTIFPQMGDYETIKRDCLATGLFKNATASVSQLHREAFIRYSHG